MPQGGAREGAGRKPRAEVAASVQVKLSLTAAQHQALLARCPKDKPLATWLREELMVRAAAALKKTL